VTTRTVSHRTNTVVICIRHNVTVSALTSATMMSGVCVPAQSLHDVYISYTDVKTLLHYIFNVKFLKTFLYCQHKKTLSQWHTGTEISNKNSQKIATNNIFSLVSLLTGVCLC